MLRTGGYINLLIALAHVVGLIWAQPFFEVTGVGREMQEMSQVHPSLPYLITLFVTVIFTIFGLYGLSAANRFRPMPFTKAAIFIIAFIYIARGTAQVFTDFIIEGEGIILGTIYSLIALGIGVLYLVGGLKKWVFRTA
ncbi:hypothetical protein EGT74_04290 [Chitinophaga lutea]|uniref:Uncharacterized protein n=1 Tax=Chitinophaga lutea TaxID=2488634 RepID=A0A3N4Q0Q6_9BACT|nr:hypothetical protein [Chitinophaga lutea]RPE12769.1 hypothetical protein EGT74_04290 [Chitinophaga lutea]